MNNSITTLASNLQSAVNDVQARLAATHKQIADGKQPLSKQDSSVVARLSAQAASQSKVQSNISNANNIISVAQSGLSSIASILTQMQSLATQVSNGLYNATDRGNLYDTFSQLNAGITKIAAANGINGNNLLSGNDTLAVISASDGVNNKTIAIQGIDISSLQAGLNSLPFADPTFGEANASAAIALINQLTSQISATQASWSAVSDNLNAASDSSTKLAASSQKTVDDIQNIDLTALQANLQALSVQQSLDFQVISQMNAAASSLLGIFR